MKNCNECLFINITEQEQKNNKENHYCTKYRTRVLHGSNIIGVKHNFIKPCSQCSGENFIPRYIEHRNLYVPFKDENRKSKNKKRIMKYLIFLIICVLGGYVAKMCENNSLLLYVIGVTVGNLSAHVLSEAE